MSALAVAPAPVVRPRIAGLYAVTPDLDDTDRLVALVDAALAGGARVVQYRHKQAEPSLRREQAARLAACCARHRRPFIVNDHADLAMSIDDAGLHVGIDDFESTATLRTLRRALGPSRILGVSCYRSLERARDAVDAGADYVAFGSVFPSTTKPLAPSAALDVFAAARGLGVPLVGIGGITRERLPALIAAGADAAAVIGDLFAPADAAGVGARARQFAALFGEPT